MNPKASSDAITRDYFDSLLFELRQIDCTVPDTGFELFGEHFSTPIMTAAVSHLKYGARNGMVEMAEGAALIGAVNWSGMGSKEEIKAICATGAKTIKIVKPYEQDEDVLWRLKFCEDCGCMAVGVDIDHAAGSDGRGDVVFGERMAYKSAKQLESYAKSVDIPFVVKGVLSVTDAVKCCDFGAAAIVLSHHHGIMPYAVPPLRLLPEIKQAVGNRLKIFIDCGIESGYDAAKCLALGADAVSVGRGVMPDIEKGGAAGCASRLSAITDQLRQVMGRTGLSKLSDFEPSILRKRDF